MIQFDEHIFEMGWNHHLEVNLINFNEFDIAIGRFLLLELLAYGITQQKDWEIFIHWEADGSE